MKTFRFIVLLLMVIGSINWGLVGFFQFNLVAALFGGESSAAARFIFSVVGVAGLCGIFALCRCSSACKCGPKCDCCKK